MEDILIFSAIVIFIVIPPTVLLSWILFKRTVAFLNSLFLNLHAVLVAVLTFTVAEFGIIHLSWAAPLAVGNLFLSLWLFHKKVSLPIKSFTSGINDLSEGNFSTEFDPSIQKSNTEIGKIAQSLSEMLVNLRKSVKIAELVSIGKIHSAYELSSAISDKGDLDQAISVMIDKLKTTITEINNSANAIALGAGEMNGGSQSVASGANEQAVSLEELSASMEEMVIGIKQNSEHATAAGEMAKRTAEKIKQVSKSVSNAVDSMRKIAEKITIVQDIAKKTDMLAINASIEASRAGHLGKGFASVALEIRRLAENVNQTASFITELGFSTSEEAMQSRQLLSNVIPDILKTSEVVQEIATATVEQNSTAEQINGAVYQLNEVTQQNASASEELAGGSEEFSRQADQLKEIISFFKLNEKSENITKEKLLERIAKMNRFIEENFGDEEQAQKLSKDNKKGNNNVGEIEKPTISDEDDDQFEDY